MDGGDDDRYCGRRRTGGMVNESDKRKGVDVSRRCVANVRHTPLLLKVYTACTLQSGAGFQRFLDLEFVLHEETAGT
jgi:hypothetical protein